MTPGAADFSVTICFGPTPFGFIAYRHAAYLVSGPEGWWLPIPSWLFALGILALAWSEWWIARWVWSVVWERVWWWKTGRNKR